MSKHKIIAIIMVPILAIGGYFVAGYFSADEAAMRVLKAKDKCRISQQQCLLYAQDLVIELNALTAVNAGSSSELEIKTNHAVNDILISIDSTAELSQPIRLQQKSQNLWRGSILINEKNNNEKLKLRLVVDWKNNIYIADEAID